MVRCALLLRHLPLGIRNIERYQYCGSDLNKNDYVGIRSKSWEALHALPYFGKIPELLKFCRKGQEFAIGYEAKGPTEVVEPRKGVSGYLKLLSNLQVDVRSSFMRTRKLLCHLL